MRKKNKKKLYTLLQALDKEGLKEYFVSLSRQQKMILIIKFAFF